MAPPPATARRDPARSRTRRDAVLDAVNRFGPPLGLMAVIFAFSSQQDLNSGLGLADLIGRKMIHATEYGLLWFLWLRALRFRRPLLAAAITVAYAVSDELHQTLVPTRVGSPIDVAIDTAGVAIAWLLWARTRRSRALHDAGMPPSGS